MTRYFYCLRPYCIVTCCCCCCCCLSLCASPSFSRIAQTAIASSSHPFAPSPDSQFSLRRISSLHRSPKTLSIPSGAIVPPPPPPPPELVRICSSEPACEAMKCERNETGSRVKATRACSCRRWVVVARQSRAICASSEASSSATDLEEGPFVGEEEEEEGASAAAEG